MFDPLAPHLKGAQRLAVLPDVVVQGLPLEALPLGDDPDLTLESRWLVHERPDLLPVRPKSDEGSGTLVAVGDPAQSKAGAPGGQPGGQPDGHPPRAGVRARRAGLP